MSSSVQPLGFLLNDIARLLRRRFDQRARCHGMTPSQWQVLADIAGNEGIQQGALAELLDMEPISLVRIIDKLSERGLVERRPHPADRRSWQIFLRDEARSLVSEMHLLGDATRGEAFEGICPTDREKLTEILTHVKTNLIQACRSPAALEENTHD